MYKTILHCTWQEAEKTRMPQRLQVLKRKMHWITELILKCRVRYIQEIQGSRNEMGVTNKNNEELVNMSKHLLGSVCHRWRSMSTVLIPWQLYWVYLHCLACAQRQRRVCHLWGGRSTLSDLKEESATAPPAHSLAEYCSQHPSLQPSDIISLSHCQTDKTSACSLMYRYSSSSYVLNLMTSDNTVPFHLHFCQLVGILTI